MRRMPIPFRLAFPGPAMRLDRLWDIRPHFYGLSPRRGQVAYVLLTSAPVADSKCCHSPAAPRLACVKPVASVHPEPGSNSSLLLSCCLSSFKKNRCRQPAPNECCFLLRSGCPVSYCAVKLIVFCCTCLGINGTNKNSPYCSLVLLVTANVSKISLFFCAHRRYFRKASAKLRQFSELANLCRTFFHHFFTHST